MGSKQALPLFCRFSCWTTIEEPNRLHLKILITFCQPGAKGRKQGEQREAKEMNIQENGKDERRERWGAVERQSAIHPCRWHVPHRPFHLYGGPKPQRRKIGFLPWQKLCCLPIFLCSSQIKIVF
jgi:hypothetical protein